MFPSTAQYPFSDIIYHFHSKMEGHLDVSISLEGNILAPQANLFLLLK